MSQYEDLTEGQKELCNNLMNEIEKGGDDSIFPILKKASQKDFLAVLNTTNIINLPGGGEFALTMLNYCAISLNPEEITKVILDVAKKDKEVLKEVLNTPNIEIKLSNGEERTITPFGCVITQNNSKKATPAVAKDDNMLEEKALTTVNLPGGGKCTLTSDGYTISFNNQEAGQRRLKAILDVAKDKEVLKEVLNTTNIIKFPDGNKRTLTLFGYAMYFNNLEERIKAILAVAKENDMLEKVLTTPNIKIKLSNGEERTLTPLGYAIYLNNSEKEIKAILDVAKDNNMLEKVLNTPNIIKLPNGEERTLTPLGYAIGFINNSEEKIKAILDVAEEVLNEVFVGIEEHDRKRLQGILETLKNQEQDEEQKTKIDDWLEILEKSVSSSHKSDKQPLVPESSIPKTIDNNKGTEDTFEIESNISKIDNSDQKDTVKTTNKSIMIGSVCGVIAALAVSSGCFAAGVALPISTLIGIAVAAALVIGVIAGGISHVVLRPSDDECLSKPQRSVVNSPKSQNKVQSQISDQEPKITIPQHLAEENLKESVSKADTNVKLTENSLNNGSETTTTDQQRALNPQLVANEPKAVGELKFVGEKLLLVTTSDQFAKCKDYRNTQSANPGELLMFIKCGTNEYRIVGNSTEGSILIKSILRKSEGDKYINGNILHVEEEIRSVKKMLDGVTEVKVESISNEPFGVKTPTTTTQQTVNNTTIDQLTSSAVTNEHKETLVNAHEEKDEHNNAASNRKVQQVEVDAEVKILMEDLLSKVSAQDLDKVEKTPISKRSEEEEFYDAEDKQLSSIASDDDTLEFQDAIDDGITQPRLITSDMVVEQVETQNTVGRVLNKSQGNNIVINGIVILEGAKLKCFPELSNFLSKTSSEREKLFCKVVPNSLLFQSRKERIAINGQPVDAQ